MKLIAEKRMKIFVPMSDNLHDMNGRLSGKMVPFNPEFLSRAGLPPKDRKPANWIGQTDYRSAGGRIQVVEMVGTPRRVAL
ncbi:MAG: hypothetical protein ACJAVI_001851 [Candidatus Azotimanducaceae bacterium]